MAYTEGRLRHLDAIPAAEPRILVCRMHDAAVLHLECNDWRRIPADGDAVFMVFRFLDVQEDGRISVERPRCRRMVDQPDGRRPCHAVRMRHDTERANLPGIASLGDDQEFILVIFLARSILVIDIKDVIRARAGRLFLDACFAYVP